MLSNLFDQKALDKKKVIDPNNRNLYFFFSQIANNPIIKDTMLHAYYFTEGFLDPSERENCFLWPIPENPLRLRHDKKKNNLNFEVSSNGLNTYLDIQEFTGVEKIYLKPNEDFKKLLNQEKREPYGKKVKDRAIAAAKGAVQQLSIQNKNRELKNKLICKIEKIKPEIKKIEDFSALKKLSIDSLKFLLRILPVINDQYIKFDFKYSIKGKIVEEAEKWLSEEQSIYKFSFVNEIKEINNILKECYLIKKITFIEESKINELMNKKINYKNECFIKFFIEKWILYEENNFEKKSLDSCIAKYWFFSEIIENNYFPTVNKKNNQRNVN